MRNCGDCQLCCKLVPVKTLGKPAGEKCQHQRFRKGCAIYARRPFDCRVWSCRWLSDPDTAELRRPDRSHYVIDCMFDYIKLTEKATGEPIKVPCLQVWLDPRYPDAHHDPALRAYLERRGQEGVLALIRKDAYEGFVLWPPSMTNCGWQIQHGTPEGEHSAASVGDVLCQHRESAAPARSSIEGA